MQERVGSRDQPPVADQPQPLLLARQGAVAVLTLDRPRSRNGLSTDLIARLTETIRELGADGSVRAIVLQANGPVFCAGHDLKEMTAARALPDQGREFFRSAMGACSTMMQAIVACPRPVIAAVEGTATAAGLQLVATCDLAVCAETATFSTPGVNIGLFCSTPMVALSRNVSRKRAMEMLLLGETLSATEAAEYGLVNRVVPLDAVRAAALAMAERIASKSQATVAVGKQAFYHQLEQPLAEAYAYAAGVMVENMLSRDAQEGIGAFLEKRDPQWTQT